MPKKTESIDVSKMPRSAVRYAIFRMRSGNPEKHHQEVYDFYAGMLKEYDIDFTTFTISWDIDLNDNTKIVSGFDLKPLTDMVNGSLFDEDGNIKSD